MLALPEDPFALAPSGGFVAAARRTIDLFGAPVELCWLPERRARRGRPGPGRPPFPPSFVERILAAEAVWSSPDLALTPNRHPFARRQLLLWSAKPRREPDRAFLEAGFALAERAGGALLLNSIGAAASIPWLHAHVCGERLPFLPALRVEPTGLDALAGIDPLEVRRAAAPFPAELVALRGPRGTRAAAADRLLRLRTCPAYGLVDQDGTTWIFPRSAEVPAPFFPQALGSAELWGRWCYDDEHAFASATPDALARALGASGYPRDGG